MTFTARRLSAMRTWRRLRKRMAEVVARDEKFVREEEPREKGLAEYEKQGEFMKVHFIERFTQAGRGDFALSEWGVHRTSAVGRMCLRRGG